jgi:methylenetetrahydrofolate reductase (NADPH)
MTNRPISDGISAERPLISVEFFPPKDEAGGEQIVAAAEEIRQTVAPDFVSITYGAGGTTRERTFRYACLLKDNCGFNVMPHLTCVGSSAEELRNIAAEYYEAGFRNFMALRGDPPKGAVNFTPHPEGLKQGADLVRLLRETYPEIGIGVAGYPEVHPEAISAQSDLDFLKRKVDQGASFITTQLFYDNQTYFDFVDRCRAAGIRQPIFPGLMPIFSATAARRFAKSIPSELDQMLQEAEGDTRATEAVGEEWTYRQVAELLAFGVPGIHLYIMNRGYRATGVIERLRRERLLPVRG